MKMPSKKSPQNVKRKEGGYEVPAIVQKVKELGPTAYANHVQTVVTSREIFLDFYYLHPTANSQDYIAQHVQRIVLPLDLGKGTATALANAISGFEEDQGVTLGNARTPNPDDKITIWP